MTDLSAISVMTTAWRRPQYLAPVLESWASADGISEIKRFVIALGPTDRYDEQVDLIGKMRPRFGCPVVIADQSPRALKISGPHTAIAEAITNCFADPAVQFVVAGEEDVQVSSDVLTYMQWAATALKGDPTVLIACAHSRNGQGWDLPLLARDHGADQNTVRLRRYFNPWGWGTWRDRWETILEPEWDYECNQGGPMTSGYDWSIQQRILPKHKMRCAVPDASRSQNIGKEEGWASKPETFALVEAFSFRERRDNPQYRLEK